MKHLTQVIEDMRIRFPNLHFQMFASNSGPSFWWIRVYKNVNYFMDIEVDIHYHQESVIACLIENRGFQRKEFSLILDSFLNSFD
jgi:hypothetical protein